MRLDLLLFRLRLAKTRGAAQRWIGEGHIRCNQARVSGNDVRISQGDVLTLPMGRTVRVIRIDRLPERRGPAAEAQSCYCWLNAPMQSALDPAPPIAIAGAKAALRGTHERGLNSP